MENRKCNLDGSVTKFIRELYTRIEKPKCSFVYWSYVVLGVIIFGGIGVFLAYYEAMKGGDSVVNWQNAVKGLATYAPAIVGAAAVQLLLDNKESQEIRAFALLSTSAVILICILSIDNLDIFWFSQTLAIIATAIALLLFWIANAEDPRFVPPDPEVSMGGPVLISRNPNDDNSGFDGVAI